MTTNTKANNTTNANYLLTTEALRHVHAYASKAYQLASNAEWARGISVLQYTLRAERGLPIVTSISYESGNVDTTWVILPLPATSEAETGSSLLPMLQKFTDATTRYLRNIQFAPSITGQAHDLDRAGALQVLLENIPDPFMNVDLTGLPQISYQFTLREHLTDEIKLREFQQIILASRTYAHAAIAWYSLMMDKALHRAVQVTLQQYNIPEDLRASLMQYSLEWRANAQHFDVLAGEMRALREAVQDYERSNQPQKRVRAKGSIARDLDPETLAALASLLQ